MNKCRCNNLDNRQDTDFEYDFFYQVIIFQQRYHCAGQGFGKIKPGHQSRCQKQDIRCLLYTSHVQYTYFFICKAAPEHQPPGQQIGSCCNHGIYNNMKPVQITLIILYHYGSSPYSKCSIQYLPAKHKDLDVYKRQQKYNAGSCLRQVNFL